MALLRHLTNAKIMGRFVQSQQDAWKHYDRLANDPRVASGTSRPVWRRRSEASHSPVHRLMSVGQTRIWLRSPWPAQRSLSRLTGVLPGSLDWICSL
jgi:hypothetical protein